MSKTVPWDWVPGRILHISPIAECHVRVSAAECAWTPVAAYSLASPIVRIQICHGLAPCFVSKSWEWEQRNVDQEGWDVVVEVPIDGWLTALTIFTSAITASIGTCRAQAFITCAFRSIGHAQRNTKFRLNRCSLYFNSRMLCILGSCGFELRLVLSIERARLNNRHINLPYTRDSNFHFP